MSEKQLYLITSKAGPWLAGRRRKPGATTIELTPLEAEYEIQNGTIVPNGQPLPPTVPVPALTLTDIVTITRNGATRDISVSDLVAFLQPLLGSGPVVPGSSPGTISTDLSDQNSIGPRV